MAKLKRIPVRKPKNAMEKDIVSMEESIPMYHPSFRVNSKQVPEIRKLDVGEKYRMEIEIVVRAKEESENESNKSASASFDITAYAFEEDDLDAMSDEEFAKHLDKKMQE